MSSSNARTAESLSAPGTVELRQVQASPTEQKGSISGREELL
jgi:hypothetical protein